MAMAAMRRLVAIGRRMNPSEMFTSLESFSSFGHFVIWSSLIDCRIAQLNNDDQMTK
jgi:hypothetical protein